MVARVLLRVTLENHVKNTARCHNITDYKLTARIGEPSRYSACSVADGRFDRLGSN